MKSFFLPVLLLIVLKTLGQVESNTTLQEWQNYEKTAFSISYPGLWDLDTSGLMGTSFFLFSPLVGEFDDFKENINLVIQQLPSSEITLDQYVEVSENQIHNMIQNAQIFSSKRHGADGETFHEEIFSGMQGNLNLKFMQRYWIIGDKAYILTLTCKVEEFDNYKDIGLRIIESFKIKY